MGNFSEVTRLRTQIAEEYEAVHTALTSVAVVARHDCLQRRLERVVELQRRLIGEVGREEAIRILVNIAWPSLRE